MGLECHDQTLIIQSAHSLDGSANLIGVVGIIVVNICAIKLTLKLHTAVRASKGRDTSCGHITGNTQHPGCADSRQGIQGIMATDHLQVQVTVELTVTDHIHMPPIGNMLCPNSVSFLQAEGNVISSLQRLYHIGVITVGKDTVCGQACKCAEGFLHIGKVLKIVQVVSFHIQDNSQSGAEIQERVTILTAFQHDGIALAYPMARPQQRQIATDHYGRIPLGLHENMGHHRGCGSFAMGAGNANCIFIGAHNHTPGLGPFKHRNTGAAGSSDLRVIVMDSCGTDHTICAPDIFTLVADMHGNTLICQLLGGGRQAHIRTGHGHTHSLQYQS